MQNEQCSTIPKNQTTRLIRIREVMNLVALSKSHIYFLSAQQLFPKRIQLVSGGTSVAWKESEILNWIDQRVAERDQETGNE